MVILNTLHQTDQGRVGYVCFERQESADYDKAVTNNDWADLLAAEDGEKDIGNPAELKTKLLFGMDKMDHKACQGGKAEICV